MMLRLLLALSGCLLVYSVTQQELDDWIEICSTKESQLGGPYINDNTTKKMDDCDGISGTKKAKDQKGKQYCCFSKDSCGSTGGKFNYPSYPIDYEPSTGTMAKGKALWSYVRCNRKEDCQNSTIIKNREQKHAIWNNTCSSSICCPSMEVTEGICPGTGAEAFMKCNVEADCDNVGVKKTGSSNSASATATDKNAPQLPKTIHCVKGRSQGQQHFCCDNMVCQGSGFEIKDFTPCNDTSCPKNEFCSNTEGAAQSTNTPERFCCPKPYHKKMIEKSNVRIEPTNKVKNCMKNGRCDDSQVCETVTDYDGKAPGAKMCFDAPQCKGHLPPINSNTTELVLAFCKDKSDKSCDAFGGFCDSQSTFAGKPVSICCQKGCPVSSHFAKKKGVPPPQATGECSNSAECVKIMTDKGKKAEFDSVCSGGLCCHTPLDTGICPFSKKPEDRYGASANANRDVNCSVKAQDCDKIYNAKVDQRSQLLCYEDKCCWKDKCEDGFNVWVEQNLCGEDDFCPAGGICVSGKTHDKKMKAEKRCCPSVPKGTMKTTNTYQTQTNCTKLEECYLQGKAIGMLCVEGKCTYFGETNAKGQPHRYVDNDKGTGTVPCNVAKDCLSKTRKFKLEDVICVPTSDSAKRGQCVLNPLVEHRAGSGESSDNFKLFKLLLIICLILGTIFLALSIASFVKYRSKNFCDKYKKKKGKKDKKKGKKDKDSKADKTDKTDKTEKNDEDKPASVSLQP